MTGIFLCIGRPLDMHSKKCCLTFQPLKFLPIHRETHVVIDRKWRHNRTTRSSIMWRKRINGIHHVSQWSLVFQQTHTHTQHIAVMSGINTSSNASVQQQLLNQRCRRLSTWTMMEVEWRVRWLHITRFIFFISILTLFHNHPSLIDLFTYCITNNNIYRKVYRNRYSWQRFIGELYL